MCFHLPPVPISTRPFNSPYSAIRISVSVVPSSFAKSSDVIGPFLSKARMSSASILISTRGEKPRRLRHESHATARSAGFVSTRWRGPNLELRCRRLVNLASVFPVFARGTLRWRSSIPVQRVLNSGRGNRQVTSSDIPELLDCFSQSLSS